MKIDKTKLKTGIWYEDENGNRIDHDENLVEAPIGAHTYSGGEDEAEESKTL